MQDPAFASLLDQSAALDRCIAEVGFEGGLAAPQYQRYVADLPARIMPARDRRYQSLLGEQTQVSHYGFVKPLADDLGMEAEATQIEVGDLLVWKVSETYLTEAVEAGATEVPVSEATLFAAGGLVEIGSDTAREQATVAETSAEALMLAAELQHDHAEQEPAVSIRRFEVLYVRSWPGLDHHVELALNEIAI